MQFPGRDDINRSESSDRELENPMSRQDDNLIDGDMDEEVSAGEDDVPELDEDDLEENDLTEDEVDDVEWDEPPTEGTRKS